jgi:hypothetical protein
MSELKPCPFCGEKMEHSEIEPGMTLCSNPDCWFYATYIPVMVLNTRPIEDGLRAELARLQEKLHDEMSQLEIATDLGNKRWVALNDIYENGEKHNANWCKRKAREGLGIK